MFYLFSLIKLPDLGGFSLSIIDLTISEALIGLTHSEKSLSGKAFLLFGVSIIKGKRQ